jgi:DNA-binding NarL/FixJ family response regulator
MQLHTCRILLVDDHAPIREALRSLLSSYEDLQIVGEAADGQEAINVVEACQPDVVLMDINMPRMNGIEASNLIKKSWDTTVIIGLCAVRDSYTIDAFMRAGASAIVSKDRLDDLHSIIRQVCQGKAAVRSLGP